MSKILIGRFVASILALLIASSVLPTHGQSLSGVLSDEDEAEVLEKVIQLQIKTQFSELVTTKKFLSDNISPASAMRIAKHGFSLVPASELQGWTEKNVVDYMAVRSIYLRDGIVVVRLAIVREVRPCFGPLPPTERSVTYEFQKSPTGWVGKLRTTPIPFRINRSQALPSGRVNSGVR